MAAIFILAGGVFGFATALASVFLMGKGLLVAFAIWSLVGLVFSALGIGLALLPRRASDDRTASAAQSA